MSAGRVTVGITLAVPRERVASALTSLGYDVTLAASPCEVLEQARSRRPHLLVLDADFITSGGAALLGQWRLQFPGVSIVVLPQIHAGRAPVEAPVLAEEPGALAYPQLMLAVERALGALRGRAAIGVRGERRPTALDPFVGHSPAIRCLAREAPRALASESPILIEGETGTGKGVLAAWLHAHGPREGEPFVHLNCAGFSRELMDSELFGHAKGAFTGAVTPKPGMLEVADKGTLFLDEIGDMDIAIQAKLLKLIEDRRFRRVGDTRERRADVRIIVATHHHLRRRVQDGLFREDLFYRISVLPLNMPALRFRSGDIPALARRILAQLSIELGRPEPVLTPGAERVLMVHSWPGNLRELRNELERAMLACGDGPIETRHLALEPATVPQRFDGSPHGTLVDVQRAYIQSVLDEEQHVERAAQRLGIARSTFYQKLRALGISPRR
jgi:DNA-binding NtrC family response regulator